MQLLRDALGRLEPPARDADEAVPREAVREGGAANAPVCGVEADVPEPPARDTLNCADPLGSQASFTDEPLVCEPVPGTESATSGDGSTGAEGGFSLAELLGHHVPASIPTVVTLDTRWEQAPQVQLPDLASRFDLKAEVSSFMALPVRARQQREVPIEEGRRRCTRLWMLREEGLSLDPQHWQQLGDCYEACADAARLLAAAESQTDTRQLADVLPVAAQVTSALRQAYLVAAPHAPTCEDVEQGLLFQWLRFFCWRDDVHVERYMRLEDPFPPAQVGGPARRLADALQAHDSAAERVEAYKGVRYWLRKWRENTAPLTATHYRQGLIGAVEKAVKAGTPPSSRDLRELLLPHYDELPRPEEPSQAYARVLDALDAAVIRLAETPEEEVAVVALPEAVATAASLLRGSVLLFIGGTPRPEAREALKAALDLEDVLWPETRPHESPDRFRPLVADARVRCVVLLIRFSSHAYGDLQEDCRALGKPLVRLPGGYNPNLVAHHIVEQAGRRLAATEGEA